MHGWTGCAVLTFTVRCIVPFAMHTMTSRSMFGSCLEFHRIAASPNPSSRSLSLQSAQEENLEKIMQRKQDLSSLTVPGLDLQRHYVRNDLG